jgi:prefoldin beta subunit
MTTKKDNKAEAQEKLMQLQMLQQRLQVFAAQKQQFQIQQLEVENALKEVSKTKKPVYSLIGGIMVERPTAEVKAELTNTKKDVDIKIKNLERQEKKTVDNAEEIQKEVTKIL